MATVVVQQQALRHDTPPTTIPRALSPVPGNVLHVHSTGSISPPTDSIKSTTVLSSSSSITRVSSTQVSSLLYPPHKFPRVSDSPSIYLLDASTLAAALDHIASQPLPDPNQVFPWLHGLHPDNKFQLAFFANRRRSARHVPKCWRGITLVKVGGDITTSRLKGAVAPNEVLGPSGTAFLDIDPPQGFSVRNFQIQTAKVAPLSDIVVYGEDGVSQKDLLAAAGGFAIAQEDWLVRNSIDPGTPLFSTFILSSTFREVEDNYPDIVAVDSLGQATGQIMDFFQYERAEMHYMTKASEIATNVWVGPMPDHSLNLEEYRFVNDNFDLAIYTTDVASIPCQTALQQITDLLEFGHQRLEFPSSGSMMPPSDDSTEVEDFLNTLRWMYNLANPGSTIQQDDDAGHTPLQTPTKQPRKIIILCGDGYTESSLLMIAYYMFAQGVPAHEAWKRLHCDKNRNFFAYSTDVAVLRSVQKRLLQASPVPESLTLSRLPVPAWFTAMDGSLPSRILPYMYLGNLNHANNPDLLWMLGIRRVLSIGEPVRWNKSDIDRIGEENIMYIGKVQDNGIDSLTQEFDRCLEFIPL
ncbi:tyrosine/serine/threonine protein phosphatase pps1 [Monascus purpureus]|uniref:Tyrosine/serine/threonine protein phosphatase pps1 n=1 Tax=Monascus purpureus TaxID=5098 RepID=A0A507R4R7_MONPU|nr:tyrosine/serine/threonine protein phosphatase pps1 [Monascus purpureus]